MTLPGASGSINRGDVLTLFGAAAFAAHIVTLGHFSRSMRFELLSVVQVGTAAVLSFALFPWAETPHVEWQPAVLWAILITGLLCHRAGFYGAGLGAKVYHFHPDRADLHAGARSGVDDIVSIGG